MPKSNLITAHPTQPRTDTIMSTPGPYIFSHPTLPPSIENKLSINVLNHIYSFLRPKYQQSTEYVNIELKKMEFNQRFNALEEQLEGRIKRNEALLKNNDELLATLGALEAALHLLAR